MKYKKLFLVLVLVSITSQYDIIKKSDQSVRKRKIYQMKQILPTEQV